MAIGTALAIGGIAGAAGKAFGGSGEGPSQNLQNTIDPFQAQLLSAGRGRLDTSTQDLNRRSIEAANQAQGNIANLQAGRLDAGSQSLISQNVDRNRRLQGARQASLASQFGAGSQLSGILGSQQGLKADLALNRQSFDAFRDQIDRSGNIGQQLGQSLGLRQQGVQGLALSQQQQLQRAKLTGSQQQTSKSNKNFFDKLGDVGSVAGKIGAGF